MQIHPLIVTECKLEVESEVQARYRIENVLERMPELASKFKGLSIETMNVWELRNNRLKQGETWWLLRLYCDNDLDVNLLEQFGEELDKETR